MSVHVLFIYQTSLGKDIKKNLAKHFISFCNELDKFNNKEAQNVRFSI